MKAEHNAPTNTYGLALTLSHFSFYLDRFFRSLFSFWLLTRLAERFIMYKLSPHLALTNT